MYYLCYCKVALGCSLEANIALGFPSYCIYYLCNYNYYYYKFLGYAPGHISCAACPVFEFKLKMPLDHSLMLHFMYYTCNDALSNLVDLSDSSDLRDPGH